MARAAGRQEALGFIKEDIERVRDRDTEASVGSPFTSSRTP